MKNFGYPIRMCIVCKSRLQKTSLLRYQIRDGEITSYSHSGRSFYICSDCIDGNQKRLKKILQSKCQIDMSVENYGEKLKEIVANG